MESPTQVVIIGAGPYGLSLASHLRERDVPFRIFGRPMQTWATEMPEGMKLKSDGFASNLFPGSASSWTLQDFCRETGRLYHSTLHPVPLEDFIAYGQEFARRFVPTLEPCNVTLVEPLHAEGDRPSRLDSGFRSRFRIRLETGETLLAADIVLAVGLSHFPAIPDVLRNLPSDMISHTADHRTFAEFEGHEVTVLGRGASALNAAALLNESGARATLISRKSKLHVHQAPSRHGRSLVQRLRHPSSPLGPSLRSWFATRMPTLFHAMPAALRHTLFHKHLGPAGGSALRGRVLGQIPVLLGWSIRSAELLADTGAAQRRIKLTLVDDENHVREHITPHIVAGTGFRVDLGRLRFLAPSLLEAMRVESGGAPLLDRHFESSISGLYFVGPAAAFSFGPLLRFAAGARFASLRVGRHLAKRFTKARLRAAAPAFESVHAQKHHAA